MKKSFPALVLSGALFLSGALAAVGADTPPPASTGTAREVATILNTSATVQAINDAPFASRGTITKDVTARIEAAKDLLDKLDTRAAEADAGVRSAFAKARSEVLARESAVRDSVQQAKGTEAEPAWEAARDALARDYEAYGAAATNAEATLMPAVETASK
jgi:hypothetical protein